MQHYVDALALLRKSDPVDMPSRWRQAVDDATEFLADWGERAAAGGWTVEELFGLDAVAPLARYDRMGLIWLLRGKPVKALDERHARIGTSTTYWRKHACPGVTIAAL